MTVPFNSLKIYHFSVPQSKLIPFFRIVQSQLIPIHIKGASEVDDILFVALKVDTGIAGHRAVLGIIEKQLAIVPDHK